MPDRATLLTEHDDYDVPALAQVSVPPREQVGGGHASTPANHVRVYDDLRQLVPVSRQEIRMPILDVAFPFDGQLDVSTKPRAAKAVCRIGVRHPS